MNSSEINYRLRHVNQFGGVRPADKLPSKIKRRPRAYIVNTDKSHQPGRHWVAFYFPSRGPAEFFDSMGRPPDFYHKRFKNVLLNNYIYNDKRLQQYGTRTCGHFCLYYVILRCRGWSMRRIVNTFDFVNLNYNERIVNNIC